MPRRQISDQIWFKFKEVILNTGIYDKARLRMTVEGILFKLKTGCPWRDVPEFFGKWNAIYKRFNEWSQLGKLKDIFFCFQMIMIMNGLLLMGQL